MLSPTLVFISLATAALRVPAACMPASARSVSRTHTIVCEGSADPSKAEELREVIASLKATIDDRETAKLTVADGPGRKDAVATMATEIEALATMLSQKEQELVDLVGVEVRYSAVGRLREKQAKEREERRLRQQDSTASMPPIETVARGAAALALLAAAVNAYNAAAQ